MTTARWNKLICTLTCWLQCGTILSCVEEQMLQLHRQCKIKGSESLIAWPASRGHANGGALFWWNCTKKILGLVGQIFYSHTEGIALIDCIEFPPCHHRRSQGGNQLSTYKVLHSLPHVGQYPLRPDDCVLSCRPIDMCYCFATPFKYSYCFPIFSDSGQWRWFQGNCTIWTHVESSLLPHVFAANVSASIARWGS